MRTAADTFRQNPAFNTADTITTLGTGEALISTLHDKGAPSIVERTLVRPPSGRVGPLTDAERRSLIDVSPVAGQYDKDIDRESAFEILAARAQKAADAEAARRAEEENASSQSESASGRWRLPGFGDEEAAPASTGSRNGGARRTGYQRETVIEAAMKSAARSVATSVGRAIVRGILGSLKR
ncbi:hypothetical protein D3C86_1627060 [compost metagenome]